MQEEQDTVSALNDMLSGKHEEVKQEDTDQQEEVETEEQPETVDADQETEASEDDAEDEGEDTLVEGEGSEEEAENNKSADDVEDEKQADTKESTEPKDEDDGKDSDTADTIDYRKQYEELLEKSKVSQDFYDKVTNAEFKVNGKMVKGFKDPDKIIQSQQLSGGLTQKLAGTKKFKPYINPLKERGMLDDPEKFNLAMNIIDGDKEALKHHLKTLDIDPVMDLDMEAEVKYANKNTLSSETQLALDDALEMAESNGVDDKFSRVLAKEWDESSFEMLMDKGSQQAREVLISNLSDGTYDKVQDRIDELERVDVGGAFGAMNSMTKYHVALLQLQKEQQEATEIANNEAHANEEKQRAEEADKAKKIKAEKAKIAEARKKEEYKTELEKKNKVTADKRKKATAASKHKQKTTTTNSQKSADSTVGLLNDMLKGR